MLENLLKTILQNYLFIRTNCFQHRQVPIWSHPASSQIPWKSASRLCLAHVKHPTSSARLCKRNTPHHSLQLRQPFLFCTPGAVNASPWGNCKVFEKSADWQWHFTALLRALQSDFVIKALCGRYVTIHDYPHFRQRNNSKAMRCLWLKWAVCKFRTQNSFRSHPLCFAMLSSTAQRNKLFNRNRH